MKTVGIIGLGYVGLPLACEFWRAGCRVIGVDLDEDKIRLLTKGDSYVQDVSSTLLGSMLDSGRFLATKYYEELRLAEAVIICVQTPLRKTQEPDISIVADVSKRLAKILQRGQIVVLESTVFPGATEEVVAPLLNESGLEAGVDFSLAFSPERIDPGNVEIQFKDIPKLVGGINGSSTDDVVRLYGDLFSSVIPMASAREAEMAKLLENTFRAVNIGLVNELAILANRMNVNLWNIIDAAATKPFGFMPFYPGPGWGGHCIPVDPVYLSWKAKSDGGNTDFIDHAIQVNNRMPNYVVERIAEILSSRGSVLQEAKILVLGVAYKRDVADYRESPAVTIMDLLASGGSEVQYHDPHLSSIVSDDTGNRWESVSLTVEVLENQDCIVIATDHTLIDYQQVVDNSKIVLDTRNATKNILRAHKKVHLL